VTVRGKRGYHANHAVGRRHFRSTESRGETTRPVQFDIRALRRRRAIAPFLVRHMRAYWGSGGTSMAIDIAISNAGTARRATGRLTGQGGKPRQ